MKADEILEKHLLLMLARTNESYASIEEMKKQPEWQTTINAMVEYAEMQALRQPLVSRCNADSDKLVECRNCGDKVEMVSSGEFCPHCFC